MTVRKLIAVAFRVGDGNGCPESAARGCDNAQRCNTGNGVHQNPYGADVEQTVESDFSLFQME